MARLRLGVDLVGDDDGDPGRVDVGLGHHLDPGLAPQLAGDAGLGDGISGVDEHADPVFHRHDVLSSGGTRILRTPLIGRSTSAQPDGAGLGVRRSGAVGDEDVIDFPAVPGVHGHPTAFVRPSADDHLEPRVTVDVGDGKES